MSIPQAIQRLEHLCLYHATYGVTNPQAVAYCQAIALGDVSNQARMMNRTLQSAYHHQTLYILSNLRGSKVKQFRDQIKEISETLKED